MAKKIDDLRKFVAGYKVNGESPPVHRFIDFMLAVEKALPRARVSKQTAARIAFAMTKLPNEDSDHVRKISKICARANEIVSERDKIYIDHQPGEGFRVLRDPKEIQLIKGRKQEKRSRAALTKQAEVLIVINSRSKELTDRDIREEVRLSTSWVEKTLAEMNKCRCLPPAKDSDIKR